MALKRIPFDVAAGDRYGVHDAAILVGDEEPMEALAAAVIDTISTRVAVKVGGHEVFLAMLLSPGHWDEDWAALGIDDPEEFVAGLVSEVPA